MSDDFVLPPRPELESRERPFEAGDPVPDFVLPAVSTDGESFLFQLSEYQAGGTVLLVFYQDDGMPICTRELKAIAQEIETLRAGGVRVAAVNTNGMGSHEKFQERDRYPFPLLSDFHGDVVKAFGMWDPDERKSLRGAIAIGPDRRAVYVLPYFNPGNVNAYVEIFDGLGLTRV